MLLLGQLYPGNTNDDDNDADANDNDDDTNDTRRASHDCIGVIGMYSK